MAKKKLTELPNAQLTRLSPDEVEFDQDNPRFGGTGSDRTQPQIGAMLLDEPHLASQLVDSLVENGFIDYEPLVVRRSAVSDKYVVIEGNRRLAAVKYLREHLAEFPQRKNDIDSIPVLLFETGQSSDEKKQVRAYLGVRHLLGLREWPPLSKAQFLDREAKATGDLSTLLKEVRLTKTQARRFLIPYRLMKKADRKIPQDEDYWTLAEALNRAGVKEYIGLETDEALEVTAFNKGKLAQVLDDLYGPVAHGTKNRIAAKRKVHETRQLSTYASVLASEKARAALHSGKTLSEAAIYVDTKSETLTRLAKVVHELKLLVGKAAPSSKSAKRLHVAVHELEGAVKEFIKQND